MKQPGSEKPKQCIFHNPPDQDYCSSLIKIKNMALYEQGRVRLLGNWQAHAIRTGQKHAKEMLVTCCGNLRDK